MEICTLRNLVELEALTSNYKLQKFHGQVLEEYERYKNRYYLIYKSARLAKLKKSPAKHFVYKHWGVFRVVIRQWHKLRGAHNNPDYYTKNVFMSDFLMLRQPIIGNKGLAPFLEFVEDIYKNIECYKKTSDYLEDAKSKDILFAILKSRLTSDIRFLTSLADASELQYFDKDLVTLRDEILCDIGAYNGNTVEPLLKKENNGVVKIFMYEPNPTNYRIAERNIEKYKDSDTEIVLRPVGVSNSSGKAFISNEGVSSKVHSQPQHNCESIVLVTLDEDIREDVTFIKMDVEGEEYHALLGAERHIRTNKPKMAICVYHCIDDLNKILKLVHEYNSTYKFYLRHYSMYNLSETVLYCL